MFVALAVATSISKKKKWFTAGETCEEKRCEKNKNGEEKKYLKGGEGTDTSHLHHDANSSLSLSQPLMRQHTPLLFDEYCCTV